MSAGTKATSSELDDANAHRSTVDGFGDEWQRFDQTTVDTSELQELFLRYFSLVDLESLRGSRVADIGCGSGRWSSFVAPLVEELHLVDASPAALEVAEKRLSGIGKVHVHCCSVSNLPFGDGSLDFVYSLGVLHHVPDTQAGLDSIARVLRPGGQVLVYLYYRFDTRPAWFRALWRVSDTVRRRVSTLPFRPKSLVTDVIAATVYLPLARFAKLVDLIGIDSAPIPLSFYKDSSFYTMRTDALDRFGTQLEQRFTRAEIAAMLERSGFEDIKFRSGTPYWCALATKREGHRV